jgi:hypothetical protein
VQKDQCLLNLHTTTTAAGEQKRCSNSKKDGLAGNRTLDRSHAFS